jgi:hypothetical protein
MEPEFTKSFERFVKGFVNPIKIRKRQDMRQLVYIQWPTADDVLDKGQKKKGDRMHI